MKRRVPRRKICMFVMPILRRAAVTSGQTRLWWSMYWRMRAGSGLRSRAWAKVFMARGEQERKPQICPDGHGWGQEARGRAECAGARGFAVGYRLEGGRL